MKFSVPVAELQKHFGNVGSVIPTRSTLPILENFLFEVTGNKLKIIGTDLDTAMTVSVSINGMKDGKMAVPAKRLMDTVRALPPGNITFTGEGASNKISLVTENGEYKLTGESSDNFPTIPDVKGGMEFSVKDDVLRRLVNNTIFAVSNDELRPAMTGIYFQLSGKEVRAVSTDGHRLVRIINTGIDTGKTTRDIIVPAKAMQSVAKAVSDGECKITLDDKHALFSFGTTTLTTRLIEEKYPNYESVIPSDNTRDLRLNTGDFLASIRRTSLYANSATHQVRLSLSKNTLIVSAEDADFGSEAKETVKCEYSSDAMDIGFNSGYLVDVMNHVETGEAVIHLSNATRAIIIEPAKQKDGENIIMLVMPVRLSS
ncbi:MAG TPA: DNA polymerase III subunit beta [Bacteroidota bacterium]|nr:DNA polymerase III subunit beta [Bacteroidota bacterium]